jgi:hypothetical protein
MAKDVSEIKKRTLAAIPLAAEAEHAHSLLEDQARGEQEALNVAQKNTDSARQVVDEIKRKLGEALSDKEAKHKKMIASSESWATCQQHQLHFDQKKMQYETAMAFEEKRHNESLAAKSEAASRDVRVSDAAAAAAYDLAAAAWTCVAAMEEKGTHVKPKMKKAETGTFEYYFKQKMEEESKQREIDIQEEIARTFLAAMEEKGEAQNRQNQQNLPKEVPSQNLPKEVRSEPDIPNFWSLPAPAPEPRVGEGFWATLFRPYNPQRELLTRLGLVNEQDEQIERARLRRNQENPESYRNYYWPN